MSFYNQKENEHCKDCWYKDAPYMSSYGTYTPCLQCVDGSEYATDMNECLVAGVQGASVDVSYRLRCGGISCTPLRRLDWQNKKLKKTLDNNPKSIV